MGFYLVRDEDAVAGKLTRGRLMGTVQQWNLKPLFTLVLFFVFEVYKINIYSVPAHFLCRPFSNPWTQLRSIWLAIFSMHGPLPLNLFFKRNWCGMEYRLGSFATPVKYYSITLILILANKILWVFLITFSTTFAGNVRSPTHSLSFLFSLSVENMAVLSVGPCIEIFIGCLNRCKQKRILSRGNVWKM